MSQDMQQAPQWALRITNKSFLPKVYKAACGVFPEKQAEEYTNRLLYVTGKTVNSTPALLKIAKLDGGESLADSMTFIAMRGLEIDPIFRQAWYIPYGSKITAQVGSQGWLAFVQRQWGITSLKKVPVYEYDVDNDTIQYEVVDNKIVFNHDIKKTLFLSQEKRGKIVGAYIVMQVKGVGTLVEAGMLDDMFESARKAKGANANMKFWIDFPAQMMAKTLVRKACQSLPLNGTQCADWALDHDTLETTCVKVDEGDEKIPDMLQLDDACLIPEEHLPQGDENEIVLPD